MSCSRGCRYSTATARRTQSPCRIRAQIFACSPACRPAARRRRRAAARSGRAAGAPGGIGPRLGSSPPSWSSSASALATCLRSRLGHGVQRCPPRPAGRPGGHVWSVDVDEDLVHGAAVHLKAAGIANATVVLGDGAAGLPGRAPFDRVQFTVGSADVPPAILDQVAPGGRLVIPMRIGAASPAPSPSSATATGPWRSSRTRWRRSSRCASPPPTTPAPASRSPATAPSPWKRGRSRTSTGTRWPPSSTHPAPRSGRT